jgi:hypothetical protein
MPYNSTLITNQILREPLTALKNTAAVRGTGKSKHKQYSLHNQGVLLKT